MNPEPLRLADLQALSRRPLAYADPERARALGLPPFVRAASSAALVGGRLVVVQDDVHALALVDLETALAEPLPLPIDGPLVQVKATKADLEACTLLPDGSLLVMGSGSRPNRRRAFLLPSGSTQPRAIEAAALYQALERALPPSALPLNVEGVTVAGEVTHFFHRGAGRSAEGAGPPSVLLQAPTRGVLALLEGESAPLEVRARAVSLGALEGVELTWSDGVEVYGTGLVFTACAEDTADVVADGRCVGAALGVYGRDGRLALARLLDVGGAPLTAKVEGLAIVGERAFLVVDDDDPGKPADLIEVPFGGAPGQAGAPPPAG